MAYSRVKPMKDIPLDGLNEKQEMLSEWSSEVIRSLDALRNERDKADRHITHLLARIRFLEEAFQQSKFKEANLKTVSALQVEQTRLMAEIQSKENLLNHIFE
jgi:hypothetical protein